jgi:TonB family protein
MVTYIKQYPLFKKFVYVSISIHIILFLLLIFSPQFPSLGRKKMIHYVSLHSLGGGGGGGRPSGGGPSAKMQSAVTETKEELAETPTEAGKTLRDLTTPQKLEQQVPSSFRHPVDKPKREKAPPTQKKATIQKRDSSAKKPSSDTESDSERSGSGSGISLGVGTGSGGGVGFGSEFSSQIGLSNFPFTYYLENMIGRISSNWLQTQVSSGMSDQLFTVVRFKIYRDGKISVVDIEQGCGIRTLDLAAVRAIQSSAPFAPLPDGYDEESLIIHLRFEHVK